MSSGPNGGGRLEGNMPQTHIPQYMYSMHPPPNTAGFIVQQPDMTAQYEDRQQYNVYRYPYVPPNEYTPRYQVPYASYPQQPVVAPQPPPVVPPQQAPRKKTILSFTDPNTGESIDMEAVKQEGEAPAPTINKDDKVKREFSQKVFGSVKEENKQLDERSNDIVPEKPIVNDVVAAPEPVEESENNHDSSSDLKLENSDSSSNRESTQEIEEEKVVTVESPTVTSVTADLTSLTIEESKSETVTVSTPVEEEEAVNSDSNENDPADPEAEAEDEEKKKEDDAEKRRIREEDLNKLRLELLAKIDEVDVPNMVYGRSFLYCVRDLEKEFKYTPCIKTQKELEDLGIDYSSMPKGSEGKGKRTDFAPHWARTSQNNRGNRPAYSGRSSHNNDNRGGGRGSGGKRPPTNRMSIDRPTEKKITLGNRAENAWKAEKIKPEDLENDETRVKALLKRVRALLNKITPTTKDDLIKEFLSLNISSVPENSTIPAVDQLKQVVGVIFDKAVEEPKFCSLYAELCKVQVDHELRVNIKVSDMRTAILNRAQETFINRAKQENDDKLKAIDDEQDLKLKQQLQSDLEESENKFRRRKFGNITFIGQLYRKQLLSSKIVNWCLYELIKDTHKVGDSYPEPPFDEESLQCAVKLIEALGQQLEKAVDFPGKEYLKQTLEHLHTISGMCSNKIRFMILGVLELRNNRWEQRKVVEQGPKKLTEIHNDIKQEQMQSLQQRESYDKRQGVRQGGSSLRNNRGPVPSRGSLDNSRYGQGNPSNKRATAAHNSKLTTSTAPPRNLSLAQVSQEESRKAWKSGASGGGSNVDSSKGTSNFNSKGSRSGSGEFRKPSNVDEKAAALAAAKNFNSDKTGSARQSPVLEQYDPAEREEKLKKLASSIKSDASEVASGDISLDEAVGYIVGYAGKKESCEPTIAEVFQRFMQSAAEKAKAEELEFFGRILCKALQDDQNKQQIIKGISDYCQYAIDTEAYVDFPAGVWNNVAKVISNAIFCDTSLFDGPRPSHGDFSESFLNASNDSRPNHPYDLLVTVLRFMAEKHAALVGDDHKTSSIMTYHDELSTVVEQLDKDKLEKALKDCKLDIPGSDCLFSLLQDH